MEHRFNLSQLPARYAFTEVIFMQVIRNFPIDQIDELVAFGQVVDHQNIGVPTKIQAAHKVAAYKASATGYYYHDNSPAVTIDVPNLPTTTPPARLAHNTASNQSRPAARVTANAASTVSPAPD